MFIVINDRFSCSKDAHGWTLTDTQRKVRPSDDPKHRWKKGEAFRITDQTFHGKLLHVLNAVIDKSAGAPDVKTIVDMRHAVLLASGDCLKAIEQAGIE